MSVSPTFCDIATLGDAQYGFLTGTAGTGKTTVARRWTADSRAVLCATTGIAAVNLGDNATTINALLGYFDSKSLEEQYISGFLSMKLRKLYRSGVRRLVLDEISMMDADQLTILTKAMREASGDGYVLGDDDQEIDDDDDNEDPLGMMLVGDFCQLSPVKAPYAFTSDAWPYYAANTCVLNTIYRQDDQDFVEALQAVRRGDVATALAYFKTRLEQNTDPSFDGTTILAKNDAVGRYNDLRMSQLQTNILNFPSSRTGIPRPEWGKEGKPKHTWAIPHTLTLKEGCLVMLLANQRYPSLPGQLELRFEYVNGDLGTFLGEEHGQAVVRLQRGDKIVHINWVTREHLKPLEPGRRKQLRENGDGHLLKDKYEIIGSVTYMPIRVAYASTVHKSQGLTLDTVQINLRDHFFTQPGMLYVALSRAKTPAGLRIVGTTMAFADRVRVDPKVKAWL